MQLLRHDIFLAWAEYKRIILPAKDSLFQTLSYNTVRFKVVPVKTTNGRINATTAPGNPDLLAFCSKGNIRIDNALANEVIRVTNYPE